MVAKIAGLFFALLLVSISSFSYAQVRVAVTPFEASDYKLQQHKEYARGELENLIMTFGNVEIVERARMDKMTEELSFGNFSGMADDSKTAQFGKMAGAKILVTGSLLKADTQSKGFGGFGFSTKSSETVATVRIRAYDTEKGVVVYSTTVKGSSSSFKTSHGGSEQNDEISAAIENALKNLGQDPNFKAVFTKLDGGNMQASKIKIEISPTPNNCDLEINGVYKGSTPTSVELAQGATITVKLTKAGYMPWEKTVSPEQGMRIAPELEKKPN